jgi:hypothetical protein
MMGIDQHRGEKSSYNRGEYSDTLLESTGLHRRMFATQILSSTSVHNWGKLYIAAPFEPDKLKLPSRMVSAERALILRARELFLTSDNTSEEGKAVDNGVYALRNLAVTQGSMSGRASHHRA